MIDDWRICCENALKWMSLDLTDDNSTLVQVMAWCRQATSHYLSQCWSRSMSSYGATRPHWFNPYCAESSLGNTKNIFSFSPHWDGAGVWNPSPCKTRNHSSCVVNILVADDLVTQQVKASAAIQQPIASNYIPQKTMDVITYPWCNLR